MIYFDNGASSYPKPQMVRRAVNTWLRNNGANPGRSGHRMSMDAAEMVFNTRLALAGFFGVKESDQIILVPSATYALNTVLLGLFEKGDHVITTELEHNSVLRPMWFLKKCGIDVTVIAIDLSDETKTVDAVMNAVTEKTKAIVCTQCSNVCGWMMPIRQLVEKKPENIKLIVDGSQGAGVMATNVIADRIDYYCAPSHKGLLGPQGGGIIVLNNSPPRPLVYGGTGTDSMILEQPTTLPERLESGTLPGPICAGLQAAISYLDKYGVENVYNHKRRLTEYAYQKLRSVPGIELYMLPYADKCNGVIPFNIRGYDSGTISEYLNGRNIYVRGGIHCAPLFHKKMGTQERGMVRISFGIFNKESEIDILSDVLKKIR